MMKIIGKDSKSDEGRTLKKSKMVKKTRVTKKRKEANNRKRKHEVIMLIKCSFSIEAVYLLFWCDTVHIYQNHTRDILVIFFGDRTRVKESVHHIFCECFFVRKIYVYVMPIVSCIAKRKRSR